MCPTFYVVDGGGGKRAGDNNKNFPIYFYNKPILPDREANIGRLAKSAQRSGGGGGGGSYPCPVRLCMQKPNSIILILFIITIFIYLLINYETAAGCRKPFCVFN